jgi:hypothetical protein
MSVEEQEFLKEKEDLIQSMSETFYHARNSYDQHVQEKSYWTLQDALQLAKEAINKSQLAIAKRIFTRWQHFV